MNKLIVTSTNGHPVNLRNATSTTAPVLMKIPVGEEVELISKIGVTWSQIKYKETTGYMMSKFLVDNKSKVSQEDLKKVYNSLVETLELIEKVLK